MGCRLPSGPCGARLRGMRRFSKKSCHQSLARRTREHGVDHLGVPPGHRGLSCFWGMRRCAPAPSCASWPPRRARSPALLKFTTGLARARAPSLRFSLPILPTFRPSSPWGDWAFQCWVGRPVVVAQERFTRCIPAFPWGSSGGSRRDELDSFGRYRRRGKRRCRPDRQRRAR